MIRVLLVDDSPTALASLRDGLIGLGGLQIVATAASSRSALELVAKLRPQVVCSGLELSQGIELTRALMRETPTPVLLLSTQGADPKSEWVSQAREAGALEVLVKPSFRDGTSVVSIASVLRVLAGVKVFARRTPVTPVLRTSEPRLVAIGASTGGPQALCRLLKRLDAGFPWPIVCVQHMSPGFLEGMVSWLSSQTKLKVSVAQHGQRPQAGHVYFAPEEHHLRLRSEGLLSVDQGEAVDGHRPSATVLLSSVAQALGSSSVGILLTGMGADGARGLLEMSGVGAVTMAQDEESSVVFGMPRQAVEMGAVKQALSLDEIGARLCEMGERRKR